MKHFFRGGRELPVGQSEHVNVLSRYQDPIDKNKNRLLRPLGRSRSDAREGEDRGSLRTTFRLASPLLRPYITDSLPFQYLFNTSESRIVDEKVIERCSGGSENPKLVGSRYGSGQEQGGYEAPDLAPTVCQLSSAQVLPWFNQKSIIPRWFLGRSSMDTRSQSCNHRGVTVRSSSKSGSRSGLGRYQVGTLSTYLSSFARYFIASEAKDRQTTGKEQATDRQTIGKEKAHKYQAKPKPSPEKEQGTDREQVENKQGITAVSTLGLLRQYIAGIVPVGIQRGYSRSIVCLTQALCKAIGLHNTYIIPTLYLHNSWITGMLKGRQDSTLPLNLLRTVYEPETHIKGTGNIHKRYMPDTCLTPIQHNNGTCLTHQPHKDDTIKCGNEGDGNGVSDRLLLSLERYSRRFGTQRSDESDVCNDGKVIEDLREKRLILKGFRELCEDFMIKVDSMLVDDEIKRQRSLKEVGCSVKFLDVSVPPPTGGYSRHDDTKRLKTYSLQLITLFCVLFSYPDLLGTSAMAQSKYRAASRLSLLVPSYREESGTSFGDKGPLVSPAYGQEENGLKKIKPIQIGDTIPEELWNMPLKVVNYPDGSDTILLKAYRSESFILLDFWSTHCGPCIRALNEFDKIAKSFHRQLPIISMHVDSLQDLKKYVSDKGWTIPVVGVNESTIVNNYFFNRKQYGGLILIMDGIFYASPDSKVLTVELFEQLLRGERPHFKTKYPELLHVLRAEEEGRW